MLSPILMPLLSATIIESITFCPAEPGASPEFQIGDPRSQRRDAGRRRHVRSWEATRRTLAGRDAILRPWRLYPHTAEPKPAAVVEKTPKLREIHCPNCDEPVVIRRDIAVTLPPRKLTEFQEHLFNLLGDLALNGGDSDELHRMLYAAMAHDFRRRFARHGDSREETDRHIATYISNREEEWIVDLTCSWPKAKERETASPATVTEYLRANVRDALEYRFREFLNEGKPEELRLMDSVLMDWSSSTPAYVGDPDLELGNSFERELARGVRWVRVPEDLRDKIVTFVQLLTEREDAA
jgi:hypothetical protein